MKKFFLSIFAVLLTATAGGDAAAVGPKARFVPGPAAAHRVQAGPCSAGEDLPAAWSARFDDRLVAHVPAQFETEATAPWRLWHVAPQAVATGGAERRVQVGGLDPLLATDAGADFHPVVDAGTGSPQIGAFDGLAVLPVLAQYGVPGRPDACVFQGDPAAIELVAELSAGRPAIRPVDLSSFYLQAPYVYAHRAPHTVTLPCANVASAVALFAARFSSTRFHLQPVDLAPTPYDLRGPQALLSAFAPGGPTVLWARRVDVALCRLAAYDGLAVHTLLADASAARR